MSQKTLFDDPPAAEMQPVFRCECGRVSPACWWYPDEPPALSLDDDADQVWCRGCHKEFDRVAVTVFLGVAE
jgi:hypothetical protein